MRKLKLAIQTLLKEQHSICACLLPSPRLVEGHSPRSALKTIAFNPQGLPFSTSLPSSSHHLHHWIAQQDFVGTVSSQQKVSAHTGKASPC